ncbi:MAG: helix-turn-helix domain-containing protein [Gammaproteobacteria bacterium]
MDMHIDTSKLIHLRQSRAWSQQQLAEIANLSLRTVQRMETYGSGSYESVKAVSSAFDITPKHLLVEPVKRRMMLLRWPIRFGLGAFAAAALSLLYVSHVTAAPVMLDVTVLKDKTQLASVHLLNEAGKTSEVRIDKQLKLILLPEITKGGQVRIKANIYTYDKKQDYQLIASPTVLTGNKQEAVIRLEDAAHSTIELDITPRT